MQCTSLQHTHRCRNLALAASTSYSTVCRLSRTWVSSSRAPRSELPACNERQRPGCRHTQQRRKRRPAAGGRPASRRQHRVSAAAPSSSHVFDRLLGYLPP